MGRGDLGKTGTIPGILQLGKPGEIKTNDGFFAPFENNRHGCVVREKISLGNAADLDCSEEKMNTIK